MVRIYFVILLIVFSGCKKDHVSKADINKSDINVSLDTLDVNNSENNSSIDSKNTDINSSDSNISIDLYDTQSDINLSSDSNVSEINNSEEASFVDSNTTANSDINLSLEPYFFQQWYLAKDQDFYTSNDIDDNASIHAKEMLKHYTGKGVTIAIIDDGLDVTHEELHDSIVATYDISTKTENVSHDKQSDYHGTAVTGIIGANRNGIGIVGIASESNIVFLKYKEGMSDSETIELFNKADELGADVINCSWGTYDVSLSVKEAIQDLARNGREGKGTIIVFAVGNDDQDMGNDESAIPEVIAVGSIDRENLRAWYSNYGENLDVLAPGGYEVGIATLDPMDTHGISTLDANYLLSTDGNSFIGSSASAPIVTGSIALILEKNPDLMRIEIEEMLKNSSDKIGSIEYEDGWNKYYGYGKVNVNRLLQD